MNFGGINDNSIVVLNKHYTDMIKNKRLKTKYNTMFNIKTIYGKNYHIQYDFNFYSTIKDDEKEIDLDFFYIQINQVLKEVILI